jgi:UPF0755 protein
MDHSAEGLYPVERSVEELQDDDHPLFGSTDPLPHVPGTRRRADRHKRKRRRRRRLAPVIAILVIVVVVFASWGLVKSVGKRFAVPDYSGAGQGSTTVVVQPGDSADDIAATLAKAGVVKSSRAFVNAAKSSGQAGDIQPGVYRLRLHSSGRAAMTEILDPANRLQSKITIPEGSTEKQILQNLAARTGLPLAQLTAAANDLNNLGIPDGFAAKSAEGFLFPATYNFDPSMSADAVVQTLATKFGAESAKIGFVSAAKALNISPYSALIIASLVESEAKFPQDRPKISRVIFNRLAANMPIGIDAANRYGLAIEGKDPNSVTFTENSPYNVRTHTGLPPTPISNPGEASLLAAVNPAAGDWKWYVVGDAAGHHLFFDNEQQWTAAVDKCRANGWGC